jgi:malonate-semialdehyde dehydrogenase (acetylating)/methylmalonate-semialdehyde dehydrogenase
MGRCKALLEAGGRRMIDRVLDACAAYDTVIVASPEVAQALSGRNVLLNTEPKLGMAHSLKLAHAGTPPDRALLIFLADKPLVDAELASLVVQNAAANEADVCFPQRDGIGGHPVYFSPRARQCIPALQGASLQALRDAPGLHRVPFAWQGENAYVDVDDPGSLARLHEYPGMEAPAKLRTIGHYIDGELFAPEEGRFGDVYDPARGTVQAHVAFADTATIDIAVQAAKAAFPAWSRTPLGKRAEILFTFRALLKEHGARFAEIVSSEHGKIVSDAEGEVARALEVVDFACSLTHQMKGEFSENVSTSIDTYSLRQPLGVCAGITPFNFPMMVPAWMFAIAIACGNTFVLKPSERDPSASLLVAELLTKAGLPAGVFNVVQGDKAAVDALLAHPGVAAISFVGSTPIAQYIYSTAAANGKRVQALGGAKNHMVVMPDADMDAAADALVSAAYGSAGQRCMAISASICVGGAADALIPKMQERIATLKIGPGHDRGNDMGPVVTPAARDRILDYIEQGIEAGATLAVDGRECSIPGYEDGFFIGPTLFDRVQPPMAIYRDEIFGPVLVNMRVETLDDALALLRANPYGNGTSIFTRSGAAARKFQSEVDAGMVGINVPIPVPVGYYSFGGWKASLFGDLHIYGEDGFRFYTRGKVVTSRWHESHTGVNLGFPTHK